MDLTTQSRAMQPSWMQVNRCIRQVFTWGTDLRSHHTAPGLLPHFGGAPFTRSQLLLHGHSVHLWPGASQEPLPLALSPSSLLPGPTLVT